MEVKYQAKCSPLFYQTAIATLQHKTMKKSLFHINEDLLMLQDLLEHVDDEDSQTEEILAFLEDTQKELSEKLDNYAELICELTARAEARKQRAKELTDLAKADESLARRLKTTLQLFFEQHSIKRQDTDRHRITLAKNGGKAPVIFDDTSPEDLPKHYQAIVVKPDTDAIRADLEAGKQLPFARLGERGQSIRIK